MRVDDGPDIVAILKSICLNEQYPDQPGRDACALAASIGAAVPEAEIAQALDQHLIAGSKLDQERADNVSRVERNGAAQDARLNATSNAVSAVAASTPTIQEAAAQNQANLQAAAAAQQRQQAREQARLAAEQNARAAQAGIASTRPAPTLSNTNASSSSATVAAAATPSPNNNPYSSHQLRVATTHIPEQAPDRFRAVARI
jgi:hypothetical protein